ncbi:MAG: MFS transporter [Deltaproteobacteria bacterium]
MFTFSNQERSWILYDVANSAFVLVVVTAVMPIFFKEYASQGVAPDVSTANWGFANGLASMVVAIAAPVLGAFADGKGLKKRFFIAFLCLGLGATFLLSSVSVGAWLYCLAVFVLARIGFAGANVFYDAFLPDVTDHRRMDWISSSGYAWGYIGSVIPFLGVLVLLFYGMHQSGSPMLPPLQVKIGFGIVGCWWLLFSVPMLKDVRQTHYVSLSRHPFRDGFARLFRTFREIRRFRQVFLFLIAYFFYIDGVGTIITMATAYGVDVGLSPTMLILAILMIQIVAFPFALLYGRCAERFTGKHLIYAGIGVYCCITLLAFFLPVLPSMQMKIKLFWLLAFLVATSMGGVQALSRSYFGKLIPADHSAEFFGFFNIFGKFAAILGPVLVGVVGESMGQTRYGVLSIFFLFLLGGFFLAKVREV